MSEIIFDCDVEEKLFGKKIAVFGCGNDGKLFFERHNNQVEIVCFIDSFARDSYRGKKVISPEHFAKSHSDVYVVISSMKYADDMCETLKVNGIFHNQYCIWDKYITSSYCRMIAYNYSCCNEMLESDGEILIPIEGILDGSEVIYSFFARFFAKRFKSSISAYLRRGGTRFEPIIPERIKKMYESFGTSKFITVTDCIEEKIILGEYKRILSNIKSLEDWENISIFGIKMGISVIRDYLRFYEISLNPLNKEFLECLYNAVKSVAFWMDYLKKNRVKTVLLWDGVHNESYLREIAISYGIPTYVVQLLAVHKATKDFNYGTEFQYLKKYFDELSETEKQYGVSWARKEIEQSFSGAKAMYRGNNASIFGYVNGQRCLEKSDRVKVAICPHIFDEDEWNRGHQVCNENYLCWFQLIGEISEKTDYDWYIKLHPDEGERGLRFINNFIQKYPRIKLITQKVSPIQLSKEGLDYVLTIGGSVGHEYPLLGVDVINGGNNPHVSFDFNFNPKNKEELIEILMNLKEYKKSSKVKYAKQIYEYYCIEYLFHKRKDFSSDIRKLLFLDITNENRREGLYDEFLNNYARGDNEKIYDQIEKIIDRMNEED